MNVAHIEVVKEGVLFVGAQQIDVVQTMEMILELINE